MKQRAPAMVRTGTFQYMRSSATPSLYRNSRVLTRRDRDGGDDHWQGVTLEELVKFAGYAMTKLVATVMTADVGTSPRDGMMEPGDVDAFVTTLPALSNLASVAELVVNCRSNATM